MQMTQCEYTGCYTSVFESVVWNGAVCFVNICQLESIDENLGFVCLFVCVLAVAVFAFL